MIGVYGARGFMGRHLVRRLVAAGLPVRAVSRKFDAEFVREFGKSTDLVEADLKQSIAMASSLQDVHTVVQLVSSSSPGLRNDHAVADILENVVPHVEFLQTCVRSGVKRCIFVSSGGTVYGPGAPVPTPETAPANPINSHGLTKHVVEKYIQMHGHVDGLEYVILRVANPFGPGQVFKKGQGLIPAILDRWHQGQPIRVYGDGKAIRDYVYVDDVTGAIAAAVTLKGAPRLVLNVGSGEGRSVNEVIAAIEEVTGHSFEKEYLPVRTTDVDIACLDIGEAERVLGWRPSTAFLEGVRKTVESLPASGVR